MQYEVLNNDNYIQFTKIISYDTNSATVAFKINYNPMKQIQFFNLN